MNSLNLIPIVDDTAISKTGNFVLDSLINSKFAAIQDKTFIDLFIDVSVPPILPFQAADLGILFGNIIDNAIEAVLQHPSSSNSHLIQLFLFVQKILLALFVNLLLLL